MFFKPTLFATLALCSLAALPARADAPLSVADIIKLQKDGLDDSRLKSIIQESGIAFTPTKEALSSLRDGGVDLDVTWFIKELSDSTTAPKTTASSPSWQAEPAAERERMAAPVAGRSGSEARTWAVLFGMGLTFGGDKLASATMTDGTSSTVTAGGDAYGKLGLDWRVTPQFGLQVAYGIHEAGIGASNGGINFRRNFSEEIAFWQFARTQRVGIGLRQTSGIKLTSSGAASNVGTAEFSGSTGTLVEYEYGGRKGARGIGLTIRYVDEHYTPTSYDGYAIQGATSINGSHFGIGCNFYF